MTWIKKYYYLLPVLLFLPALGNFFSGDDWFHLWLSDINSLQQFLNFFSFTLNDQTASFYRPLPTQVFFFVAQNLFGLAAPAYYLFGLILFGYSLHLVYKFSDSKLAAFIYGVSVSNFTRIYFVSAFQELFLVIFSLLMLINYKKKPLLSLVFFVLALLSKETAIVLPVLIFVLNFKDVIAQRFSNLRSEILISVIYTYYRLFHFGLAAGDSYTWDFSPLKALNTLFWYILWSIGSPELLIDYVSSGFKLIPRFFIDYPFWWPIIIFLTGANLVVLALLLLRKITQIDQKLVKYGLFFLVALLPVIFLPSHKFTLELGLPLVGFSMAVVWLLGDKLNKYSIIFLSLYVLLNISMNFLTHTRHYSVSRGVIAKKVYQYFANNYPEISPNQQFIFINDAYDYGQAWGQSKQVSLAVSGSELFKVLYKDSSVKVFYEDIDKSEALDKDTINISTAQFLNQ